MLMISETYVNLTRGHRFGDSGWYRPYTEDRGKLFRDLQSEFGRCTGRIYVDGPDGQAWPQGWVFCKRQPYEDTGELYEREVWVTLKEVADTDND